jgi:hypothetical protein
MFNNKLRNIIWNLNHTIWGFNQQTWATLAFNHLTLVMGTQSLDPILFRLTQDFGTTQKLVIAG